MVGMVGILRVLFISYESYKLCIPYVYHMYQNIKNGHPVLVSILNEFPWFTHFDVVRLLTSAKQNR